MDLHVTLTGSSNSHACLPVKLRSAATASVAYVHSVGVLKKNDDLSVMS